MQLFHRFDAWISEFSLLEFPQPMAINASPITNLAKRVLAFRQHGARFIQQLRSRHGVILSILVLTCQAPMCALTPLVSRNGITTRYRGQGGQER